MSFSERLQQVRTGFERPFWVANITELFERLSYYAALSSLARYLNESLHFSLEQSGSLTGLFGFVWILAVVGGTVADRLGFRRALSLAYLILTFSYFLLGSLAAPWLGFVRDHVPLMALVIVAILLPAFGIAMVKPAVVGTTARASNENVRSIGYAIYYTLVNIGGAAGPYVASWIHRRMTVDNVFRVAALSVFLMFFAVLLFFREPRKPGEVQIASLGQLLRNFGTVVCNVRFMLFLLIFTGYWIMYWQEFTILPIYVHNYVNPSTDTELMLVTGPVIVIAFTVLMNVLTQKIPAFTAVIVGTVLSGGAWIVLVVSRSVFAAYLTLVLVAIGEITQSPRYYEYISRLAPSGQQGTYMGFAFLPIGIGSLIAGVFGGRLIHHYGEVVHRPQQMWWAVAGVGLATALLLWIYDRVFAPAAASTTA